MIADRVPGGRWLRRLAARAVLAGALGCAASVQAEPSFVLRDCVDALRRGAVATLAGTPVARPGALSYVYAELGYEPIWVRPWGARQFDGLLAAIDGAVAEGLLPRDYHRARLEQLRARSLRVEFLFPNAHDVYLHDTPDRYLFTRNTRAVSHGCIRLEHPLELAYRLLGIEPGPDPDPIARILASAEQKFLALERPVPVYVLYLTAWPEERTLQWREDIYERDRAVLDALDAPA